MLPAPVVAVNPSPLTVSKYPTGLKGRATPPLAALANKQEIAVPAPPGLLLNVMSVAVAPQTNARPTTRSFFVATAATRTPSVVLAARFALANFGVKAVRPFCKTSVAIFAVILSVVATLAGWVSTSTSPILLDPAGQTSTIFLIPDVAIIEVKVASVAAPVGKGNEAAEIGHADPDAP